MQPNFDVSTVPIFIAPLALLVAALVCALLGDRQTSPSRLRVVPLTGVLVAMLTIATVAPDAIGGATVLSFAARLFRVGSLDGSLGFVVDAKTISLAFVVLIVLAVGVVARTRKGSTADAPRQIATMLVAGSGALCASLAEGFPTLLLGAAVAFSAARLFVSNRGVGPRATSGETVPVAAFASGLVLATAAIAVVFWGLGGRWLDESRYLSDYQARFVVEDPTDTHRPDLMSSPHARGTLTVVSHPGARVYLGVADESHLARSEPFAETPVVRKELAIGLHKVAIAPGGGATVAGDGLEVALVDTVSIRQGAETLVQLMGPTLSFHELDRQLRPLELGERRLGPSRVGTVSGALIALALLAIAFAFRGALGDEADGFNVACAVIACGVLIARLGPLASLSPWFAAAGVLGLALVALYTGLRGGGLVSCGVAAVGCVALSGASAGAFAAAAAIGPGLAALSMLRAATPVTVAPRQSRSAPSDKQATSKRKAAVAVKTSKSDEGAVEGASKPRFPMILIVSSAAAALPIPFIGAYPALASAIVPSLFIGAAGVLVALGTTVVWVSFAWTLGRRLAAIGDVAPPRLASILGVVGCLAGVDLAVILEPWSTSGERGWFIVFLVGLAPWMAALSAYSRARSGAAAPDQAPTVSSPTESAPRPVFEKIAALIHKLDAIVGLPLAWIDWVSSTRSKPEPSSQETP